MCWLSLSADVITLEFLIYSDLSLSLSFWVFCSISIFVSLSFFVSYLSPSLSLARLKITRICLYLFQHIYAWSIHLPLSFLWDFFCVSLCFLSSPSFLSSLSLTLSLQRLEFIRFWNVKWWTLKCPQFVKSPLHNVMNNFISFCHV